MPVMMNSFLLPISPALPFLLEDKYLRGGMQCVDKKADMESLHVAKRKVGMLVSVAEEDGKTYKLAKDKTTWEEAKFGGGDGSGGTQYLFDDPLVSIPQPSGELLVTVAPGQRIPQSPGAGFVLTSGANQALNWMDMFGNTGGGKGVRRTVEYECPDYLYASQEHVTVLDLPPTILLIRVHLNAFDVKVEAFYNSMEDDRNPYTFASSNNFYTDEGVFIDGDVEIKHRRFSVLATEDGTAKHRFRFTNIGSEPVKPKMTLTYLVLE